MKSICFYFEIHQPFRLKRYRFFNIGNDHYYYDDFANEDIITRIAQRSYIPAAQTLLKMIEESNGAFKCAFSLSGVVIEQLEQFVPEFIDLMRKLVDTGCVEILSETYCHSLASIADPEEFASQVREHDRKIFDLFGVTPKVFRNTELIYCDELAPQIQALGFKGVLTEGAKHILGWKSPNYMYACAEAPEVKMLLRNDALTEAISHTFQSQPINADEFMDHIANAPEEEQIFNLFMRLEALGDLQPAECGIFDFMAALPKFAAERGISFITPSEAVDTLSSVAVMPVPHYISWAEGTNDISSWLGNDLQNEAFRKLYSVAERVRLCTDRRLKMDWHYLQGSDHLYFMSFRAGMFSPYETPFQAFTNYMNVLADFMVRVEEQYPMSVENEELNALLTTIRNQSAEIEALKKELSSSHKNIEHYNEERKGR